MSDVTRILAAIEQGDPHAADELLPLVYNELRQLAAQKMAQEQSDQTLQPTALVHEAYLRLVKGELAQRWESRGHFFAAAAEAMRRILVERARHRRTQKHSGGRQRLPFDEEQIFDSERSEELLALDAALNQLADKHPIQAQLVQLRYFSGVTIPEAAEILGISKATADRYWAYARAWLHQEVTRNLSE